MSNPTSSTGTASLPAVPGLSNAFWFATFNALSYQIILGSPMVLYTKGLGASATVLGIIAGMMPLLVIFQIPAARHIGRVGYRRFVLAGWGTRVMFIFLMTLVPLTSGFLSPDSRIALLLFLLFGFNLSRGISSAAWLPWITAIVPAGVRGRYLARDSACVNGGSALTLLLAGLVLGSAPSSWRFAAIFAFSAIAGTVSLTFLKRIPEAPTPATGATNPESIPWRAIVGHPPFRRLLWMNVAWSLAYGGMTTFTVAYLKVAGGLNEDWVLFLTATSYVGGLGGLALFGTRLDHHGSRPALLLCVAAWGLIGVGWMLVAGGVWPVRWAILLPLQIAMGLGFAIFSMANTRLAMTTIPVLGRDHFFALFSVVANLALGIAPILWGLLIDAFGSRRLAVAGFEINRYSAFFALTALGFLATLAMCRNLEEPRAGNVEVLLRDLLRQAPLPSWMRFWPRG